MQIIFWRAKILSLWRITVTYYYQDDVKGADGSMAVMSNVDSKNILMLSLDR